MKLDYQSAQRLLGLHDRISKRLAAMTLGIAKLEASYKQHGIAESPALNERKQVRDRLALRLVRLDAMVEHARKMIARRRHGGTT